MDLIKYYFNLWKKFTLNSFSVSTSYRFGAVIFFLAKFFRFLFFLIFLLFLLKNIKNLSSFTIYQVIFFFLTFNLIDNITQLFFREVYRFRPMIIEGRFDYVLLQPANPLFRILAGGADLLDLVMLIPLVLTLVFFSTKISGVSFINVLLYCVLFVNSLIITTSFHILVCAVGILTTTVDHTIMIYRDLTSMGRMPIDIYREPLKTILTFVIPIGVVMTFPAKAFMGLLSIQGILISFLFAGGFFYLSLVVWRYALTKYSSASS